MKTLKKSASFFPHTKAQILVLFVIASLSCVLMTSCGNLVNGTDTDFNDVFESIFQEETNAESLPAASSSEQSDSEVKYVNIVDYVSIKFSKNDYNGYAKPELVIDEEGLNSAANQDKLNDFNRETYFVSGGKEYTLSKLLDIRFAQDYDYVSNGDNICIKIYTDSSVKKFQITEIGQLESAIGIKLSTDTLNIKAENLINASDMQYKLSNLVSIDYGIYNGYGSPTITSKIYNATNEKIYDHYVESLDFERKAIFKNFPYADQLFEIKFKEAYNYVSNNDKVYYAIQLKKELTDAGFTLDEICKGLCLNLDCYETYSEVTGLIEPDGIELIDVFSEIESLISLSGTNGYGEISLNYESDYKFTSGDYFINVYSGLFYNTYIFEIVQNSKSVGTFKYYFYKEGSFLFETSLSDLSEGDFVEIKINANEDTLANSEFAIASTRYNIKINENALGRFITPEMLKDERLVNNLIDSMMKQYNYAKKFCNLYIGTIDPGTVNKNKSPYVITAIIFFDNGWWEDYDYVTYIDPYVYSNGKIGGLKQKQSGGSSLEKVQQTLMSSTTYQYEKIR